MGGGASTTPPHVYPLLDSGTNSPPPFHTFPQRPEMEAGQKQKNARGGVWARVRALIRPPRPPDPSLAAVMAQWAEYELIFNDILARLNAQLARQAKIEKQRLARMVSEGRGDGNGAVEVTPVLAMTKAELRAHFGPQRPGPRLPRSEEHDESAEIRS